MAIRNPRGMPSALSAFLGVNRVMEEIRLMGGATRWVMETLNHWTKNNSKTGHLTALPQASASRLSAFQFDATTLAFLDRDLANGIHSLPRRANCAKLQPVYFIDTVMS
ncbi:hypothetical protein EVAR_103907_1 [Eumeta japonica]|uniref:Uncharacterized protein n=1 Tax=Eumeta variegata TaxID=151549 RepID=A0A4C2A7B3_EUMVA|nr:hypothetical protein EVAR_103907_1 [Eumeta japonica]